MNTARWQRYICPACGWIYDEEAGDPDGGLAPGTRYEAIPDDWFCPLCGVTKADFVPFPSGGLAPSREPRRAVACASLASGARGSQPQSGIIVVGGSTAAWALVEALRRIDNHRPITMVTACSGDRYDKPELSTAMARGVSPDALVRESAEHAAKRLNIHLLVHTRVHGVSPDARRLRTTHGGLRYGDLVLALGARPRVAAPLTPQLAWSIQDREGYALWRVALARRSLHLGRPAHVLMVGAGLVGCELAHDLSAAGHSVQLLERGPRPLPMAQVAQSESLLRTWQSSAVQFAGEVELVSALRDAEGGYRLEARDGRSWSGDLVVSALGLEGPLLPPGLEAVACSQGVAVDAQLRTALDHVHALGDCVCIEGRTHRTIQPILKQAEVLAARLAGQAEPQVDDWAVPIRFKAGAASMTLVPHGQ